MLPPKEQAALSNQAMPVQAGKSERQAYFGPEFGLVTTLICDRGHIGPEPMAGPVIIEEYEGTAVVPPDATVRLDERGSLIIELDV